MNQQEKQRKQQGVSFKVKEIFIPTMGTLKDFKKRAEENGWQIYERAGEIDNLGTQHVFAGVSLHQENQPQS